VTDRTDLFLAIIAGATLIIAFVQVGVMVAAGLVARRVSRLVDQVERDITPLFGYLHAMGRDASRTVELAAAQVERADRLFADVCTRVEQTAATVQATIETPLRDGRARLASVGAALNALRDLRRAPDAAKPRGEGDEALFI
jgi:hypothetical protein